MQYAANLPHKKVSQLTLLKTEIVKFSPGISIQLVKKDSGNHISLTLQVWIETVGMDF